MPLELPLDVETRVDRLPELIRNRVDREFPPQERHSVCQKLAAYGVKDHETSIEAVLDRVLDHAKGHAESIESLVIIAKKDWRDLFYDCGSDPYLLIGKLLKNLRFRKVFTDDEVVAVKGELGEIRYDRTFDSILRVIRESRKQITGEQFARIVQIGGLLGFSRHAFDWLNDFVMKEVETIHLNTSQRPWWKFWR